MKILITGIAGHLGSKFAQWVIDNHPEVEIFGLDDLSSGYEENVPDGVCWNTIKLGSSGHGPHACHGEIAGFQDLDYVFHFAAYAAEGLSPFVRQYNYHNNLIATAQVVNLCIRRNVKRLVFASSMAVYGDGAAPFAETDECIPIDPYGNAKLAAERDIQIAGEQHGLSYCILRPHNIYGPGQDIWTPYRNVLGIWMRKSLEGLPMLIYGDGEQERAFSYIDDVLPCFWQAATNLAAHNHIINLGGEYSVSIKGLAYGLDEIIGQTTVEFVESRYEVKKAWCTTEKSKVLLGYQLKTPERLGVNRMWEWAKEAWEKYPERRNRPPMKMEIEDGLYSFWKEEIKI